MTEALKQAETLKMESTQEIANVEEKYQLLSKLLRECDNGLQPIKPGEILGVTTKENAKKKERCLVYFHTGACKEHDKGLCKKFHVEQEHYNNTKACDFGDKCKFGLMCRFRHQNDAFAQGVPIEQNNGKGDEGQEA